MSLDAGTIHFEVGTTRVVVMGAAEGHRAAQVIKVAKVPVDFLSVGEPLECIEGYLSTGVVEYIEELAELVRVRGGLSPREGPDAVAEVFGKGVKANLLEAGASDLASDIVVPTGLTVNGVANVQDFAPDVDYDYKIFQHQQQVLMAAGLGYVAGYHTISGAKNFGLWPKENGGQEIRFRDCGDERVIEALRDNRNRVREALDWIFGEIYGQGSQN